MLIISVRIEGCFSTELEHNLAEYDKNALLKIVHDIADINIHYIRKKKPKGLGHAVMCAQSFVNNELFVVIGGR